MEPVTIRVTVHPNAGKDILIGAGPARYEAWVRAKPVDGRANEAVVALIARGFRVPAGAVRLLKGRQGRVKVFSIRTA